VIVEVEVIKPRFHIFSSLADIAYALGEKLQRFDIAIRSAFVVVGAPMLDFPGRALVESILLNPREHLAVALSCGEFGFQRFGRNSGEPEPMMIHRVVVFVFACRAGDFGAAFVEDAGEHGVAAETHAWTARRTLGEVRRVIQSCIHVEAYQRNAFRHLRRGAPPSSACREHVTR